MIHEFRKKLVQVGTCDPTLSGKCKHGFLSESSFRMWVDSDGRKNKSTSKIEIEAQTSHSVAFEHEAYPTPTFPKKRI